MTIPEEPQTNRYKSNEKTPKYREGNNLQTFFKLYELTANLNGWTQDQEKLAHIHTSFKGQLQEWVISQTWDSWSLFKEALVERQEAETKDEMYYLEKLLNTKRKKCTTINNYIIKFDKLVQNRRCAQSEASLTTDLDFFYIKIFIKNVSPADLRRHLKEKTFTKLTEAYKAARKFDDEDSSDESDSEDSSNHSSSGSLSSIDSSDDESSKRRKTRRKKSTMVKPSIPKIKEMTSLKTALLAVLEKQVQMMEQQQTTTTPTTANPRRHINPAYRCYNCKEPGHFDAECPHPCKHCGGTDHKRYQCARKPSRIQLNQQANGSGDHSNNTNINANLFMHMTDADYAQQQLACSGTEGDLLAMKRLRSEAQKEREYKAEKRAKYKADREAARLAKLQELININRAGPSTPLVPPHTDAPGPDTRIDTQPIDVVNSAPVDSMPSSEDPEAVAQEEDPIIIDPLHSNTTPVEAVEPSPMERHPVQKDPLKVKPPVFESKTATVVSELRNQKVFNLSFNEIIALSSKAHTEFRRTLVSKAKLESEGVKNVADFLLNQECVLPEGNHAPRVIASLNGVKINVILDTGCTPCIISYRLVERLGLKNQLIVLPSSEDGGILVGDGRRVQTKGILKSLKLELLPGCMRKVNALCLDVPTGTYDFLCGRIAMAEFGLCADLGTSSWFVRNGDQFEDLDVYHTAPSSESSCFLVTVVPDQSAPSVPIVPPAQSTDEEKFEKLFKDIDSNGLLTDEQRQEVKALLISKSQAFGIGYNDLTQTNLVKFHVDTGDAPPVYKRPYQNMSFSELESLKKEIGDMLKAGTLIPAMHSGAEAPNSGWSFQVMYVPKKNGEKRLVTMFQDLNKVTITDPWPLPNINNLLETFGGCTYLSSLDLLKGFNQIACDQETIPKMQITTPFGCFCYTVMPFGVRNGPSTFARAIYLALKDFDFCATYIDDNQVFSHTYQEHLKHIEMVFDRMIEVNMKLNPNKCVLFRNQLDFLGFQVSTKGISPITSKVDAIQLVPTPKDKSDVRAFINMAGFYRRHIDHFSDRTIKMTSLLKKNVPFVWGPQEEEEFTALKNAVANATLLRYPNSNYPYVVYSDASDTGIAAVLCQTEPDGNDVPICFVSRKLKPAEINYATVEKELLAVVYALFKFRRYVLDRKFTVYTDNMAVKYMFSKKEPNSRLQRWCLALQEYDFIIKHVPGTRNPSDFFSRYPLPSDTGESGENILEQLFSNLIMIQSAKDLDYEDGLKDIYRTLSGVLGDQKSAKEATQLDLKAKRYRIGMDHHLYRLVGNNADRRYVKIPFIKERAALLVEVHEGHGHFGINSTWSILYRNYWWPGVYQQMKTHLESCHECQVFSAAPHTRSPHLGNTQGVLGIFKQFAIDYVGPLPVTSAGSKYILVCTEMFTRWPMAVATKEADAITAATFLYEEIFTKFGPVTTILSDNGTHFANQVVKSYVDLCQSKHKFGTPYHPESQGMVEKFNHTLVTALRKLAKNDPRNWDTHISTILYAYRVRAHEAIGISPYELLFGVAPLPADDDPLLAFGRRRGFDRLLALPEMRTDVVARLAKEQELFPSQEIIKFTPGTQVLFKNFQKTHKLSSNWSDTVYTIVAAFNNNTYTLADMSTGKLMKRRINGVHLRRYFAREASERCRLQDDA